ncbi:MAG: isoprenyl transferase [Zhenhengia sp.]|jgi:undecaprenyl diphosphate synthase|uniref:isoprenyl transferase n=1 Tax=Zhenhengia sp. TaxID=2944208 RepID=UPI002914F6AD|nr:isoprenyl transferase [Clostridiales bacterium]MDU6975734.1 isoprenyl transferase [Clostridiales bacterium]
MIEKNKLPRHVAIIMDGNGRWAKERGFSRNEGHKKGSEVVKKITNYAEKLGIEYLTVYAFSTENWKRPQDEVDGLMNLLRRYLKNHIKDTKKNNAKFRVIGDRIGLPQDIQNQIEELEGLTKDKSGICINIAINYGGRDEIIRACRHMIEARVESNVLNEELFESFLDTKGIPDPDLMIRTSGEMRTSNYLPWQLAYSEFYFTPCLWPDFTTKEFDKALEEYSNRKRRFGKSE